VREEREIDGEAPEGRRDDLAAVRVDDVRERHEPRRGRHVRTQAPRRAVAGAQLRLGGRLLVLPLRQDRRADRLIVGGDEERGGPSSAGTGTGAGVANRLSVMSGSRARWLLLAAALAPLLLAPPAQAEETKPSASATYSTSVGSVVGATRPAGSLHIGTAVGQETDRTYLRFNATAPFTISIKPGSCRTQAKRL